MRREEVRWIETISRAHYRGRWLTVSSFLVADDDDERAAMVADLEAVLESALDTRGREEFELPQVTDVFVYRRA
ncbi:MULTISPECIES: hypothetical protein [unclassified Microbacterium]|uniref:hypothetical protein n=1 Tax=unclassified Microbacterium TaxID=2609290 RepID=UPI001600B23F|nr:MULTISPECIES: hypothetical protein [unclassified Microbacterium]MBT2485716.1 hypothetical protein [Microbacterium sp. ISL-108]